MGVLAVDFCQVPARWADHEGLAGQAQDGWWGIPRNGGIAWDQDADSIRDTESGGEKSFIAHPAQAVDSMPPASAGTARAAKMETRKTRKTERINRSDKPAAPARARGLLRVIASTNARQSVH